MDNTHTHRDFRLAIVLAVDNHNSDYIDHPLRVASVENLPDFTYRIVGVLHDIVEDTKIPFETVEFLFGEEVSKAIDNLTHRPNEKHEDYFKRINSMKLSQVIKYYDTIDNISRSKVGISKKTLDRREKKYKKYLELNDYKGEPLE